MKKIYVVVAFFLAVLLWYSTILWIPSVSENIALKVCGKPTLLPCKDNIAVLGATGDIFGAVNSLFSGLALFAVAMTIWIDSRSRREARKPLVVTSLKSDSVYLDQATIERGPSMRLTVRAPVINKTGEPALNVFVTGRLRAKTAELKLEDAVVRLPLMSQGEEDIEFVQVVFGSFLQDLLSSLTDDSSSVDLVLATVYTSLEGVKWSTEATYEVRAKAGDRRKRLNAVRSKTDDFEALWQNDAAVQLDVDVKKGTWRHNMV